ncbi:coiled-coil domain containing protein, putative [Entamoeba invadens IP1]|uniref:Coiled-coil domain containing protein, putative n=1 Tax=Entamoeba invadens IP1 TaxID=370355 RepID=A0A0A1TYD1_ENTIV|nr:coiled-coil domain containing protein, putative [Entamoeba invadens IP1]ELP84555.1 coiled-coil domain containing protein, putative [Entamoeba invadens IP1]|eukprot:XP_004183901.1 coiled-coil domain containing protein, putative [Entamoeba invadens IP1]
MSRKELGKSVSLQLMKIIGQQHKRAYTAYLNNENNDDPHIDDLNSDLHSGVALIKFLEKETGKPAKKYNKAPKSEIHDRDNLEIFLSLLKENINATITAQDIIDKNEKQILQLMASLVKFFLYKNTNLHSTMFNVWFKKIIGREIDFSMEYPRPDFWAKLFNYLKKGLIDISKFTDNSKENMKYCFEQAKNELKIPLLIDPEETVEASLDDEVLTMYLVFCISKDEKLQEVDATLLFLQSKEVPSMIKAAALRKSQRPKTMNLSQIGLKISEKIEAEADLISKTAVKSPSKTPKTPKTPNTELKEEVGLVEAYGERREMYNQMGETELELHRTREDNERLRKAFDEKVVEIGDLNTKVNTINDKIKATEEELETLKNQKESEENRVNLQIEEKTKLAEESTKKAEELEKNVSEMAVVVQNLKNDLEAKKNELGDINKELENTWQIFEKILDDEKKSQVVGMRTTEKVHEGSKTLANELVKTKKENEEKDKKINEKDDELEKTKILLTGQITATNRERDAKEKLLAERKESEEKIENARKIAKELEDKVEQLEKEKNEKDEKINNLEENVKQIEKEKQENDEKYKNENQQLRNEKIEKEKTIFELNETIKLLEKNNLTKISEEERKKHIEELEKIRLENQKNLEFLRGENERVQNENAEEVKKLKEEIDKLKSDNEKLKADAVNILERKNEDTTDFKKLYEEQVKLLEQTKEDSKREVAEIKKQAEVFSVVDEDERKSLFISIALAIKLVLISKTSNELNITELYEEVCQNAIPLSKWNQWLTERMSDRGN